MEFDPDLSHLTSSDFEFVYEPAEDSFLMMEALHSDIKFINNRFAHSPISLEIGVGSGVLLCFLARLLRRGFFIGSDVNPRACEAARKTIKRNKIQGDIIRCDLLSAMDFRRSVDLLIFNPPYVPTPAEEMTGDGLSMSWAGGLNGSETLFRLFSQLNSAISPSGLIYLVVLKQNRIEEIIEKMNEIGFEGFKILERRAGIEMLAIWRFHRISVPVPVPVSGICKNEENHVKINNNVLSNVNDE